MSIMPPMLHSLSPKCSGTPANAPAASTSKRSRDVSCFRKVTVTLLITYKFCQAFGRPPHVRPRDLAHAGQCPCHPRSMAFAAVLSFLTSVHRKSPQPANNSTTVGLAVMVISMLHPEESR
jgi:hypothetical protein